MNHAAHMRSVLSACLADVPHQSVHEWCAENLVFDEANNHGAFRLTGCEYIADVLDDFADPSISDEVLVWGSQTRKTGTLMGGVAWSLVNDPCGFLWVMPSLTLAKKFSSQRWSKLLEASPAVRSMIPTGAKRHQFSTMSQMLGGSTINFVGSNSPANLASNPCRRVILDEVDKFDTGGHGEADAVELSEQRTKDQVNPQRWKTSTPTLYSGLIWQAFLKGDQRRYFMPCPYCSQFVLFLWSEKYTVLPKQGCEAYVKWDGQRDDGSWDFGQVERTAHYECPHCQNKIRNDQKTKMVREGKWQPTNLSSPAGYRSRHLSSLYSTSPEVSIGKLAVKFLQALGSATGLQGFINGDLAEPDMGQESTGERIELIRQHATIETTEWNKLLTVDCQARSPYNWFIVRAWSENESVGIEADSADTVDDLRAVQDKHSIKDVGVMLDSGWGTRTDAEIYQACARFGEILDRTGKLPIHIGWLPAKGMPSNKRWRDEKTGLSVPWYTRGIDPYFGTAKARMLESSLFEFAGDFFKDVLERLRHGKVEGIKWSVSDKMASDEYWKHMDAELKREFLNRKTRRSTWKWIKRDAHWPNHFFDCEVEQVAFANYLGIFKIEFEK